jgi:hypothetical protein
MDRRKVKSPGGGASDSDEEPRVAKKGAIAGKRGKGPSAVSDDESDGDRSAQGKGQSAKKRATRDRSDNDRSLQRKGESAKRRGKPERSDDESYDDRLAQRKAGYLRQKRKRAQPGSDDKSDDGGSAQGKAGSRKKKRMWDGGDGELGSDGEQSSQT